MHKPNAEIEKMIKIHSVMWLRHEAIARNKPNETYELGNDSSQSIEYNNQHVIGTC